MDPLPGPNRTYLTLHPGAPNTTRLSEGLYAASPTGLLYSIRTLHPEDSSPEPIRGPFVKTKSKSQLRVCRGSRDEPAPPVQKVALNPATLSPTYGPSIVVLYAQSPRGTLQYEGFTLLGLYP